jgi:mono/diheme cytochrome c family protein
VLTLGQGIAPRAQEPGAPGQGTARSVWDGVFTSAQARRGGALYAEHCASCHGSDLQGGTSRALTGDRFWTTWQETTVDRLLGHTTANMPHSEDGALKGTLGDHVYADITAHILSRNGFPAGNAELNATSAVGVRIIRKEGPGVLPAGSFVQVVGCLAARGADRNWRLRQGSAPARIVSAQDGDVRAPLGSLEYVLKFVLTPLDKMVGHRVSVRAAIIGEGGADGLNVTSVESVSATCE